MQLYQALITLDGWTFLAQVCNLMIQLVIFKKLLLNPVKKVIAERKAKADSQIADAEKLRTEAEAMKAKIEDDKTVVQIQSKAGEDSRLFGSIPSKQIAQALDKQYQIKVDKRKIDLKQPIRSLGFTNVTVNLFPGIDARIRVHVIEQK